MTSQNPENGSKTLSAVPNLPELEGSEDSERRRMPRLSLTTEQFRLTQNGKIFPVADLSMDGMALRILDKADLVVFPVGSVVDGILNLNRVKHPVKARIRHIGQDLIGCQFQELSDAVKAELSRLFDPKSLGAELKPIPSSEPGVLWYHGPSGTDLLFWRRMDGTYTRFALFVLGNFVQWDEADGLSTGVADHSFENSEIRGVIRFETMLLKADSKPSRDKLSIAKTIVMSSNLPQDLKKWCERHLMPN